MSNKRAFTFKPLRVGGGDEIDDDLVAGERLSAQVHGDVRKQAMLYLVPLACAGMNATDRHGLLGSRKER